MSKLEDYDIEKMYQEMLDESNQERYAKMLKDSDPILYEVGLSEYENEIIYNLEQREVKRSSKQNWTQIDYIVFGNEEALFKEHEVIFYQKRKGEEITENSIAESIAVFDNEKEALEFYKYAVKNMNLIKRKIEGKNWDDNVSPKIKVDDVVYKNWEKLNNIFEEGVVPKQQKKKSMKIK